MATKRWFARKELYSKSEQITFDVAAPNQLLRRINGLSPTPLAVTTDLPLDGVTVANVTIGGNLAIAPGSYLTYTGVPANPFGVSTVPASDTITITRTGVYLFEVILDVVCGAAPEIPCEVWCQLEIGGVSINNSSMYTEGGIGSPSRSLRTTFVHGQGLNVPTQIRFEVMGNSIPNGTPITLFNARVFITVIGLPAV